MSDQKEFERLKNMVPTDEEEKKAARSLQDAVDSHQTLEGFEAMNNEHFSKELEEEAANDNPQNREKGHPVP
jgi:hypothetical protein